MLNIWTGLVSSVQQRIHSCYVQTCIYCWNSYWLNIPQNTSNCLPMKSYKMTFKKITKISLTVVKNSQAITLTVCVHVHAHISSHSNWWNTSPHSVGMATTFGIVGYIWRLGYMLCCENISHISFKFIGKNLKEDKIRKKNSLLIQLIEIWRWV